MFRLPLRGPAVPHSAALGALFLGLALSVLALSALAGCEADPEGRADPQPKPDSGAGAGTGLTAGPGPEGLWFQLREGRFEQIEGPTQIQPTTPRPWTVQERIADMVELGGSLYLAVNGHGVAGLALAPAGFPRFRPFYDPLLFRHRTFTQILRRRQSLLCHAYFNALLNETTADALELQGISLLELFPEEGVYRHRTPPFQRRNPQWECVGFVPADDREALLAWKHSGPEETRFAYTRLDLSGGSETATNQEAYRSALAFGPIDDQVDPALRAVARAAWLESRPSSAAARTAVGLQFLVRTRAGPLDQGRRILRYQILPPEFQVAEDITLLTFPVESGEGRFTLLSPEGALLWAAEGSGRLRQRRLPELPEGFAYTDLRIFENLFVAAWEQRSFTAVGAAGLFLWKDPQSSP